MNSKTVIIAVAIGAALLGVVALTLMLLSEQQDSRSRAANEEPLSLPTPLPTQPVSQSEQTSCPVPSQVANVLVEYPNCIGEQCNFNKASCSWSSVAGATKFGVTVTEVETNTVVRDEEVEASMTRIEFDINQNHTYKCDVAAVNSCGASGPAGSHSLFCATDTSISPTATPQPTAPPASSCGQSCTGTTSCAAGLTCVTAQNGQGVCAIPSFQAACAASPSETACCTAQPTTVVATPTATLIPTKPIVTATPVPTIVPTGIFDNTIAIGAGVIIMLLLGAALFIL